MTDKPWWKSNVMQVIILFEFVPAAILFVFGQISTQEGQSLMLVLTTGCGGYLIRDQGSKLIDKINIGQ